MVFFRFVDIGGIIDHLYSNFLQCIHKLCNCWIFIRNSEIFNKYVTTSCGGLIEKWNDDDVHFVLDQHD